MIIKEQDEDFMGNDIIQPRGQRLHHTLLFLIFLIGQLGVNGIPLPYRWRGT
jgi:hypothetical protein